ncbi:MAG: hypothetical protein Q9196_004568 [Gyalolechia fulgens]
MLLRVFLCSLLSYLLLVETSQILEGRYAIEPRQDALPPAASSRETSTQDVSAGTTAAKERETAKPAATSFTGRSSISRPASEASMTSASANGDLSSSGSPSSTANDDALLSASPIANNGSALPNSTTPLEANELPIKPTITPALSVAGATLMLTGLFYTLIGIKTKRLHIFLSAAYLTSLATTVLIVYVMHPPISNAVQGAFFVACFVTGVILGGCSVIFTDMTEGLGCLLGGYCLAMWFLVLTPGGLIKSNTGKVIFIACFTLGAFGFYASRWTRAYGLIGAISFAGATVVVLGIDCFSRAGLKEFWLYIWDLNDDLLPLHYHGHFPITRGIRVEIAAIVIIFLLGVMSQMRIWKIIKRRRERRAVERSTEEQRQEQAEEELGRKVEEGNEHDRTVWEAAYGRKSGNRRQIDSGIGTDTPSVGKASLSIVGTNQVLGSRPDSIELDDLERGPTRAECDVKPEGKGKARATVTVRVASDDDDVAQVDTPFDSKVSLPFGESGDVPRAQVKPINGPSGPEVTPLPFQVPQSELDGDRRSSIAVSIASDHFSTRVFNRLSGGSLRCTVPPRSRRSYVAASTSEEALMVHPEDYEDRASSVEAAVDEDEVSDDHRSEVDGTTLAGLPTPDGDEKSLLKFSPPTEPHPIERPERKLSKISFGQPSSQSVLAQEGAPRDEAATNENHTGMAEALAGDVMAPTSQIPRSMARSPDDKVEDDSKDVTELKPTASDRSLEQPALRESLAELDNTSKVVMTYRTNEWAKHLDRAEKPSIDDLRAAHTKNAVSRASTEKPVPIDIPALQQTPLNAQPPPAAASLSKLNTSSSPHINRSSTSNSPDFTTTPPPQRTSSQSSLDSLPSQSHRASQKVTHRHSSQQPAYRTHRTPSTPLTHTPIEEDIQSTTFPQRSPYTSLLPTTNTLLSRRESLLQSRPSSTSLTRAPYASLNRIPSNTSLQDDDNIPLSQRRASLVKQHQTTSPSSSAYPFPHTQQPSPYSPTPSPAPLNFRTSASHAPRSSAHLDDLLVQKRRSESNAQREKVEKRDRDWQRDARWRSSGGGMEERHREAMRKLQAGVGEK